MNFSKKNLNASSNMLVIIAVIFLSIGVIVGFLAANISNKKPSSSSGVVPKGTEDTFEAGWKAARDKIEGSYLIPVIKGGAKSLKGSVAEVQENKIIISADLLNPLDDQKLAKRIVNAGENTKIIMRTEKSRETIREEHDEYNKKMDEFRAGNAEMPPIPEIYEEKEISVKNLSVGQLVIVESNENIRDAEEFTASKIMTR